MSADDPLIGELVAGRYRVLSILGAGGMGTVYEAVHDELGRKVAVKRLNPSLGTVAQAVARFEREARAVSLIGHPGVIQVFDLGRLPDGSPYMVMERLEGRPLDVVIQEEAPLPPQRVAGILRQAAAALDALHGQSVIHRDIKPSNLFLVESPTAPTQVKVLDFGLVLAPEEMVGDRLTATGSFMGSPHYMAPEATDKYGYDHRVDLYALAVVTFEMLTGWLPFDDPHPMRLISRKLSERPPSLADMSGRVFPDALEDLMRRALSIEPDERPATATAFVDALDAAVAGMEGSAPPQPMPQIPPPGPSAAPATEMSGAEQPATGLAFEETRDWDSSEVIPPQRPTRWPLAALGLILAGGAGYALWASTSAPTPEPEGAVLGSAAAPQAAAQAVTPDAEAAPALAPSEAVADASAPPAPSPDAAAADAHTPSAARPQPERRRRKPARSASPAAVTPSATPDAGTPRPPVTAEDAPKPKPERDSRAAATLTERGTSALFNGELGRAAGLFRRAIRADQQHGPAWRGLGLALQQLQQGPEAIRAYQRYLTLSPQAADVGSIRARINTLSGAPSAP